MGSQSKFFVATCSQFFPIQKVCVHNVAGPNNGRKWIVFKELHIDTKIITASKRWTITLLFILVLSLHLLAYSINLCALQWEVSEEIAYRNCACQQLENSLI